MLLLMVDVSYRFSARCETPRRAANLPTDATAGWTQVSLGPGTQPNPGRCSARKRELLGGYFCLIVVVLCLSGFGVLCVVLAVCVCDVCVCVCMLILCVRVICRLAVCGSWAGGRCALRLEEVCRICLECIN